MTEAQAPAGLPERFEVRGLLGTGGMATVYLARDRLVGGDVALKVLHAHLRSDALVVQRFRREISAARRIAHPNVIAIHDLVENEQTVCLVLEHHPGLDLKRRLRLHGPLPPAEVLRVARQVLGGLEAAHAHGIVHRDLKPQNLLCDEAGVVKIADFGLARVDDLVGLTTNTMTLGTPEYMAPELLSSPLVDGRADLYALGVTLYELVTGKLPYRASSPMALLSLVRDAEVPDPAVEVPGLELGLRDCIRRAMAKQPEDRFQTAGEMRAALDSERRRSIGPAEPEAGRCQSCRAPMVPGLAACVECKHAPVRIASTREGKYRVRLRKFRAAWTFEHKHRLVAEIEQLGGVVHFDTEALDKQLRELPVAVASGLDQATARLLAERLRALELPAEVSRRSVFEWFYFLSSSNAVAAGRALGLAFFLAVLTSMALIGAIGPMLFFILPLLAVSRQLYRRMRPVGYFDGTTGALAHSDALTEAAVRAFGAVRSPRLRAILRRTLSRGAQLLERARRLGDAGAEDAIHRTALAALEQGERVARVEEELSSIDPAHLWEEVQRLDAQIAHEKGLDETEALIERKTSLAGELERRARLEREVVHGTGELLRLGAALNEAGARLGDSASDEGQSRAALSVIARDLDAALGAREELSGIAEPSPLPALAAGTHR